MKNKLGKTRKIGTHVDKGVSNKKLRKLAKEYEDTFKKQVEKWAKNLNSNS